MNASPLYLGCGCVSANPAGGGRHIGESPSSSSADWGSVNGADPEIFAC